LRNRRNDITQGWEFCSLKYGLRKGREKKEDITILILAGKIKSEKNERNENENYYLFW